MATLTAKYKPYPAYKPSGIEWLREIPKHWEIKRLKYVADLNPKASEGRKLDSTTEVSFVPMESVGEYGGLDLSLTKELADVGDGYTYFADGDVLVAKITPCFENGKGSLAAGLVNGVAFGTTELHVLRCGPALDRGFAFHLTLTDAFRKLGEAEMYGAGGQKRVPESFFTNLKHPIPSLPEQRAITAFLDRETAKIDALVSKKERLIELLREKRNALISHAVTKGLDPTVPMRDSGVEWLGEIPTHWEVRRLKYSAYFRNSKLDDKPEDAIYVGLENMEPWTGELLLTYQPDSVDSAVVTFAAGDVLFGKLRPYLAKVARPDFKGTASSEVLVMQPLDECSQSYLAYCLLNAPYIRWIDTLTYGARMPRVSPDELACSFISLPPLPEQRAIATFLDHETAKLDGLVAKVEEAIARLKELRIALISAAVTGQIDVREEAG